MENEVLLGVARCCSVFGCFRKMQDLGSPTVRHVIAESPRCAEACRVENKTKVLFSNRRFSIYLFIHLFISVDFCRSYNLVKFPT